MKSRIEQDSMGEVAIPSDALYGAQTQRAINNFSISQQPMPEPFIIALLRAKQAAAMANAELELLDQDVADAISDQVDALLTSDNLMQHFPVDRFQTGSGTSSNMNANEVLAHLAGKQLQREINPNDEVNLGQSSNDTIPSAIHISSAMLLSDQLIPALNKLSLTLKERADELRHITKTGRTHLMDAMPVTFGQTLNNWSHQLVENIQQLKNLQSQLHQLAQGGTAVGTGINAHPDFSALFCRHLSLNTGIHFSPAENYFTRIGSQDVAVALSGSLKTTAVALMKIANDLRWMNSGPLAGLGEITLTPLQPGSSIMPGKVNPVIPEAVAMAMAQVIGNDSTITIAGQSGNFELNVMLPLIACNLIESLQLLTESA
ncbi:MAG: class II fumarate hydratase, partial [Oceanospirillum sp.]|nr:class II fumarate hydratase [Oceanospirillum sp.]